MKGGVNSNQTHSLPMRSSLFYAWLIVSWILNLSTPPVFFFLWSLAVVEYRTGLNTCGQGAHFEL